MQLIVVDTRRNLRRTIPIGQKLTFGSGEDAQVLLAGPKVLPRHCRIELTPEGYRVVAFQSDPGVRVNGRQLRVSPLKVGDVIHIGTYQLVLMPDEGEAVPAGTRETPELRRIRQLPEEYLEEKLERLETRRTWRRRKNRAAAWVTGSISLACLVGLVVILSKLGVFSGAAVEAPPVVDVTAAVFQANVLASDGKFDEAQSELQLAGAEPMDAATRERLEKTRTELAKMKVRYRRAGDLIEEALRYDAFGDGPRALAQLERVVRDYADLRGVREAAWGHVERLRKELPEDARRDYEGLLDPRPLRREYIARIDAYLDEENYSKATSLAKALTFATEEERAIVEETQKRVQELTDHAGADYLEFVNLMLDEGRLMVAYNLLEDESIEHFKRTEPWYQLLERADEVEDFIDEKVPANIRPVQRRKHGKPRPRGQERRELSKLTAQQLKDYGREWAIWEEELADAEAETVAAGTDDVAEAPKTEAVKPVLAEAEVAALKAEFAELLAAVTDPQSRQRLREIARDRPELVAAAVRARWAELCQAGEALSVALSFPDILARRKSLEVARASALQRIEDADTYREEGAEDWPALRREIADLVDAVREVYGAEDRSAPDPRVAVSDDLESWWAQARPVFELLPSLTGANPDSNDSLAAVLCLVPDGINVVTVRTLALDQAEREHLMRDLATKTANKSSQSAGKSADREMLAAINNYRALMGRPRLAFRDALWSAADKHLKWMKAYGKVDVYEQEGERHHPRDRAAQEGADNWSGEICIEGSSSAKLTFKQLLKHPAHDRQFLFADHTELGVRADGKLWVLVFGGHSEFVENL